MNGMTKRVRQRAAQLAACLVAAVMAATLFGCAGGTSPQTGESDNGKTVVSMMFFNNIDHFKELVESTYDDIEIDYELSTLATFNSQEVRRLKNGHGHDLIMTSMTTGDIKDYVADLSAYDFSTRYQSAVMNRVKQDGKTMYLPLPSSYYGYVMNVTLVEQLGLEMPTTQQELLELLRTAQQQGVGAAEDGTVISTNNVDGYALGNMITGAEVPDFLGLAQGEEWLSDFLAGGATFAGSWDESLDFFLTLTDEGLMDIERLDGSRNVVNVQKAMAEGQMIACFGSSLYLDQIRGLDSDYEFTMLPFLSAEGHSSWVMSDPVACIAINKTLEGEGNEAKLDACVRVLDLLSTPEGQQAIMEDTKADNSYLTEPVASVKSEQTGLEDAAAAGYTYSNRLPSDVVWTLGMDAIKVAKDTMTVQQALADVDEYYRNGPQESAEDHSLVGSVNEDLLFEDYDTRKGETALGNLVADAVAETAGVDIAFVNGGGIRNSLYAGDVYRSDLATVVPFSNTIVTLDVDGKTIKALLENAISQMRYNDIPGGRFLQVSGLSYEIKVDPSTETADHYVDARLVSVKLADGTSIDDDATYRIAVNDYMCGAKGYADNTGDGFTMLNVLDDATEPAAGVHLVENTGKTYADALVAYFEAHDTEEISSQTEGRIVVDGAPA